LIGSRSAHAADHAVCDLIGWPPERLPTLRAADELGIPHAPRQVAGVRPERIRLQLPTAGTTRFGPEFLQPFLRRHLFRRPVADVDRCRLCGACWEYCPAQAIQSSDDRLKFDYNRCIRCYCCIEVCPHGAMTSAETVAGRGLRFLRSRLWDTDSGEDL
jgi:ferredoxin